MQVFYVLGHAGAGKTTLASIIAYTLFLRNYQVGILDLTDQGKGYFFRFGACDFFALGDGSINIPHRLLVTLQDISELMNTNPQYCFSTLPLMPGLKICLSAPGTREEKLSLAKSFINNYQEAFDILFVEIEPPLEILTSDSCNNVMNNRLLVVCSDNQENWPNKDKQLLDIYSNNPKKVKVILNKQRGELTAATKFVEINSLGVNFILPDAFNLLSNTTVMEMCKYMNSNNFLKRMIPLIQEILLI